MWKVWGISQYNPRLMVIPTWQFIKEAIINIFICITTIFLEIKPFFKWILKLLHIHFSVKYNNRGGCLLPGGVWSQGRGDSCPGGVCSWGVCSQGGVYSGGSGPGGSAWGVSAVGVWGGCLFWEGGVCSQGRVPGVDPLGRPLLQAVRILLECILVFHVNL